MVDTRLGSSRRPDLALRVISRLTAFEQQRTRAESRFDADDPNRTSAAWNCCPAKWRLRPRGVKPSRDSDDAGRPSPLSISTLRGNGHGGVFSTSPELLTVSISSG
jgi:hypothetical protein